MPRGPRLDAEGALHHVMARGIEGRDIFLSNQDREDFINRLSLVIPEGKASLYAWALQRNHLHLFLKTGKDRLSRLMCRLLTGYSVYFNRRYKRVGYVFQNRYKSILVEEEAYFLELVRYIHLNPIRSQIVKSVDELDEYPWTGHSVIMGHKDYLWQDSGYVLELFGNMVGSARLKYKTFVLEGVREGSRPDLAGGGLIRSIGGRQNIPELKRGREKWAFDERILGSSEFVSEVMEQTEQEAQQDILLIAGRKETVVMDLITSVGNLLGLNKEEITSGSRSQKVVEGRYIVSQIAVRKFGLTATEVGRELNISVQSVLRGLERGSNILREKGLKIEDITELRK